MATLGRVAEQALLLSLPVALFFALAFVVFGLALGQADFAFDQVVFPVHGGAHAGIAFLLDRGSQSVYLPALEQQFAGASGIGDDVGGGGFQRLDVDADEPGFAVLEQHVAVGQLDLALAQTFDFPTLQGDTRFKALAYRVVVAGALVEDDGVRSRFFLGCLGHGAIIRLPRPAPKPGGRAVAPAGAACRRQGVQ